MPWSQRSNLCQTYNKSLMRSQRITATMSWEICLYKGNRKQPVAEGSNWTWAWTVCFWWGVDWMRPPASTVWLTVRSTTSGWQVKHNSFHLNELLAKCKSVHLQAFFQPLLLQLCTCAKHQLWSAGGAAKTEFITFFVCLAVIEYGPILPLEIHTWSPVLLILGQN